MAKCSSALVGKAAFEQAVRERERYEVTLSQGIRVVVKHEAQKAEGTGCDRVCNLYSLTRSQEAMRRLFAIREDLAGNLPPLPDVFPDQLAPIVRAEPDGRRLEMMRWGMPGPPQYGGAPITNIRNATLPRAGDIVL